jgi:hypothetical protein
MSNIFEDLLRKTFSNNPEAQKVIDEMAKGIDEIGNFFDNLFKGEESKKNDFIKEENFKNTSGRRLVGKFKGIRVEEDAQWFNTTGGGLKIAAITTVTMNTGGIVDFRIVVEPIFSKLSQDCKMFILYHEFGHVYKGHLDYYENNTAKRMNAFQKGGVHYKELEADAYAAESIGYDRAIKGLKELNRIIGGNAEVERRIEVLEIASKKVA